MLTMMVLKYGTPCSITIRIRERRHFIKNRNHYFFFFQGCLCKLTVTIIVMIHRSHFIHNHCEKDI